jgi:hypothetical protein
MDNEKLKDIREMAERSDCKEPLRDCKEPLHDCKEPRDCKEPQVVRMRRSKGVIVQDCDVYIGRGVYYGGWKLPGSKWCNTFKSGRDGTLEEVLQKYENKVRSDPSLMSSLHELTSKRLGCWCVNSQENPDKYVCHGNVLVKLWREKYSQ